MGKNKYDYKLTRQDDGVPEDYIGLYRILDMTNSTEDEELAMLYSSFSAPKDVIRKIRMDCLRKNESIMAKTSYKDFGRFWNEQIFYLIDIGANYFSRVNGLVNICHLIECFQHIGEGETYASAKDVNGKTVCVRGEEKQKYKFISFGIKKSFMFDYMKSLLHNTEFQIPEETEKFKRSKYNQYSRLKKTKIPTAENPDKSFNVLETTNYELLKNYCEENNIAVWKGIDKAIEDYLHKINAKTDDASFKQDSQVKDMMSFLLPEIRNDKGTTQICLNLDADLHRIISNIVKNYNIDPENINKKRLTMKDLINMAIEYYINKAIPNTAAKYSDPKRYEEIIKNFKAIDKINSAN